MLRPVAVIHKQELWLFKNQTALESVKRGLAQSAVGEVVERGSFAEFADDEDDD